MKRELGASRIRPKEEGKRADTCRSGLHGFAEDTNPNRPPEE